MAIRQKDPENRQEQITETATDARQASYGKPVLLVLLCGLVLAVVIWGGVEMWGETIDTDSKPTASTAGPIDAKPPLAGSFDNNPADGSSRPPEAIDRSPSPSGNGGGPTQVTSPSGTEKVR
jgi:hypothetical protein